MLRLALGFYLYGATVMDVFVYYPSWPLITGGWLSFKASVDQHIIPLYVVPFFLVLVPAVLMFWYRPVVVPRWMVWSSLILLLMPLVATVLIQLPIQFTLTKGFNQAVYDRLIRTDYVYREGPVGLGVLLNGWMLLRVCCSVSLNGKTVR